jgi:hypothetical protein
MPESLQSNLAKRAERPQCLQCQAPALVQRSTPGRTGFEYWTLRCTKCGRVSEVQIQTDPMRSKTAGWLSGDLQAPR